MWKTDPVDIAGDILARISTFDSTAPAPSDAVLFQWAEMISHAKLAHEHLAQGVVRVYAGGGEPPKNKIGAVIAEAREARKLAHAGSAVAELTAGESQGGSHGYVLEAAYRVDDAGHMDCPTCKARPGEVCEDGEQIKKIPHTSRLAVAYRTNNPVGRREHESRRQHLSTHRRTFKPSWTGN